MRKIESDCIFIGYCLDTKHAQRGAVGGKTNSVRFGCKPNISSRHISKLYREGLVVIEVSRQLQSGR